MLLGGTSATWPPLKLRLRGRPAIEVLFVERHLWLGLEWTRGKLDQALWSEIAAASSHTAGLAGLAAQGTLPLAIAVGIHESRVEGAMRFGRWLLAASEGALQEPGRVYESWARNFFGSPPWRSGAEAATELG